MVLISFSSPKPTAFICLLTCTPSLLEGVVSVNCLHPPLNPLQSGFFPHHSTKIVMPRFSGSSNIPNGLNLLSTWLSLFRHLLGLFLSLKMPSYVPSEFHYRPVFHIVSIYLISISPHPPTF